MKGLILRNEALLTTVFLYLAVFMFFINLTAVRSSFIGIALSLIYLLINAYILGKTLLDDNLFFQLSLGMLLTITLLSLVSWIVMIIYNLDVIPSVIALSIVATASVLIRIRAKAFGQNTELRMHFPLKLSQRKTLIYGLYLFLVASSLFLLYLSRRDEAYTVWQVVHPAFLPTFFTTTFLLLTIIFSTGKVEHKLAFIIMHSILSHSLIVVIFPAGNVGVQQTILGQTRLVFDNLIPHGFGWTRNSLPLKIYVSLRGENLQAAISVIFARMLGIDVYWTHLLLIPVLWGTCIPLATFKISKKLCSRGNRKLPVLSSLIVSLFPTTIVWGYASIPIALGYLFFFFFLYFLLEYLQSNGQKEFLLVVAFLALSFISHYLTGTVAFSLLLLANSVKTYQNQKHGSRVTAKLALFLAFIFSASLLPFALAYRRLFYPSANTFFSLEKFRQAPLTEMLLPLLMGSYYDFIFRNAIITTLIFGVAPLVGLIGLTIVIFFKGKEPSKKTINTYMLFLFLAFLLVVADDRFLKFFMVRVPFVEPDRLWVFRDLIVTFFTALVLSKTITSVRKIFSKYSFFRVRYSKKTMNLGSILVYFVAFVLLSGWVTISIYYAYPHYGPLQTTTYEIEAVKYIDETTQEKYIVICDQWIIFAGQMFVGINNPRAFYFSHTDPRGVTLFIEMKNDPSNDTLINAMGYNDATVAYFIIEKPRLDTKEYNHIIQQAQQNNLQTYHPFYHKGEEKLRIFYYRNSHLTSENT